MKSPPKQMNYEEARDATEDFIRKHTKKKAKQPATT